MQRTFYIFDSFDANGDHVIGLLEDGVPKAVGIVPRDLYPPHDQDEANNFSIAVVRAFGQKYPMTDKQKELPWVE